MSWSTETAGGRDVESFSNGYCDNSNAIHVQVSDTKGAEKGAEARTKEGEIQGANRFGLNKSPPLSREAFRYGTRLHASQYGDE